MPSISRGNSSSFSDAVRRSGGSALLSVFTCIPGVVHEFDAASARAVVQPAIDGMEDGLQVPHPPLLDVPVIYPSGGSYMVTFPLIAGDGVLLLFSQRGITDFKDRLRQGEDVANSRPDPNVYFRVQDAVALPGFVAGDVNVSSDAIDVRVPDSGALKINGRDIQDDTELVGTADVNVVGNHQWVATGIAMPEDANWFYINFGRGNAGAQRAGDWHTVLGSVFRGLDAETAGTGITGQPNRALLFERAHGNVDQFIGRTSSNELLVTTSAAHVDSLGLQVLRSNPFY